MVKSIVMTTSKIISAHLGTCLLLPALPSPAEGSQHPTRTAALPVVPIVTSAHCRKKSAVPAPLLSLPVLLGLTHRLDGSGRVDILSRWIRHTSLTIQ